jgi:hypothetical protein
MRRRDETGIGVFNPRLLRRRQLFGALCDGCISLNSVIDLERASLNIFWTVRIYLARLYREGGCGLIDHRAVQSHASSGSKINR